MKAMPAARVFNIHAFWMSFAFSVIFTVVSLARRQSQYVEPIGRCDGSMNISSDLTYGNR